ncbi:MAG: bifunctional DNA primase/polymerase [Cyanobacteria bacterium J06638_20]
MANAPDASELSPYLDAGFTLIPLHKHDKTTVRTGKDGKKRVMQRGKSPIHSNWTARQYGDSDQAITHMRRGYNVGVRLRADQVVIDVDPRNFADGDDPLSRLAADYGLDLANAPTVITGSGGKHIYFTKPKVKVLDTLEGYDGIEFKSAGRQVVAAGSMHPDTRELYRWNEDTPHIAEAPKLPKKLGKKIVRREVENKTEGGEYSPEQIEAMLDSMDPHDFDSNDPWFRLMQAVHQASGGDAREEFIAWSTSDPEYSDNSGEIGLRWDSLSTTKAGSKVGKGTLDQLVIKHGDRNTIPKHTAKEEFGDGEHAVDHELDEQTLEAVDEASRQKSNLEAVLDEYWYVAEKRPVIAVRQLGKGAEFHEEVWVRLNMESVRTLWANKPKVYQLIDGKRKAVPLFDVWVESPRRKTAAGFEFDPTAEPILKARDGTIRLNEWRGWGYPYVQKEQGWSILDRMLWEVFCDGREDIYEYILNWCAYVFQHPERTAEVAFCMRGGKGVGKGTLGNIMARLCGQYGVKIEDPDAITNNFNQHLENRVFLFADEAVRPYDKKAESKFKSLLTEPTFMVEPKGVDKYKAHNYLHVMMASNENWVVPMDMEHERRFFVVDAAPVYQGNHAFWVSLHEQMEDGGYEAFLYDMLHRDIEGWHPRKNIPRTRAMDEQKIASLDPIQQWFLRAVHEGFDDPMLLTALLTDEEAEDFDWDTDSTPVPTRLLYDDFERFCAKVKINAGAAGRIHSKQFGKELRKVVDVRAKRLVFHGEAVGFATDSQNRVAVMYLPSREKCIEHLQRLGIWEPDDPEDDDPWL